MKTDTTILRYTVNGRKSSTEKKKCPKVDTEIFLNLFSHRQAKSM